MYGNGYSLLPIGAGVKSPQIYRGFVTEDGDGPWFGLPGWQALCTERESAVKVAAWGRMANAQAGGLGLACGYGGVVAVDIDDDDLLEPLLAVLPPVLVAKRGRKGATLLYRAAHPLPSNNYKGENGRGLLDFLSTGKQTVLPPSIHPDTGKPYVWTTERTLLDTPVAELPEFTGAHHSAMEDVLRQFGWDAPEPRQPPQRAVPVQRPASVGNWQDDAFDRACLAGRGAYLPLLNLGRLTPVSGGWRAIPTYRPSSTGKSERKRALNLAIRNSGEIFDHGTGEGFNDTKLVARCLFGGDNRQAAAWLRSTLGIHETSNAQARPVDQGNRVSLADAVARLEEVSSTFAADIQRSVAFRNRAKIDMTLFPMRHPIIRVRSEAGIGKTHVTLNLTAAQARLGRHLAYVVPDHKLAAQVRQSLVSMGVTAEIYRGFEQNDPRDATYAMCRNIPAYEAVRALGLSARSQICERRIDGKKVRCPFATECGMEWQREKTPQVWILTSAMLFIKRPDFIPEPDGIVIDESFIDGAFGDPLEVDIKKLLSLEVRGCQPSEVDAVQLWRARLAAAVAANGDGPLTRAALLEQDIGADEAADLSYLERRRLSAQILQPDFLEAEVRTAVYRHGKDHALARDASSLWQEIATFIGEGDHEPFYGDRSKSGRLTVAGSKISVAPLRIVHRDWRCCPALILDATAPPAEVLNIVLGEADVPGLPPVVRTEPDVAGKWSEHVHVRQIVHAPVSMGKLGLAGTPKPENEKALLRLIRQRAAMVAPALVGLITYKGLLEKWAGRLPTNVLALHFGNLAGMNQMQSVIGLIVIGRPRPPKHVIESATSILVGRPVVTDSAHYTRAAGGICRTDGTTFGVTIDRHTDPLAEALRWRKTEGELAQAIGRIRPHRRDAPCWLDIVSDVPLVWVHEIADWSDIKLGAVADLLAGGVVLVGSRDAMQVFGLTKRDAESLSETAPKSLYSNSKRIGGSFGVRRFTYRVAGRRGPAAQGYYLPGVLPGGVAALREWLEQRLGPISDVTVTRAKAKDSETAQAMFGAVPTTLLGVMEADCQGAIA